MVESWPSFALMADSIAASCSHQGENSRF